MAKSEMHERIEHNLTLHPPKDDVIGKIMDDIRREAKQLGHLMVELVPESRELSMALTHLEDCVANAIGGIARNQREAAADQGVEI